MIERGRFSGFLVETKTDMEGSMNGCNGCKLLKLYNPNLRTKVPNDHEPPGFDVVVIMTGGHGKRDDEHFRN